MQKRELYELLEGASDAAFVVASDGRILAWNATAEALFGYTTVEAMRRSCHELLQGVGALGTRVCHDQCEAWKCAHRGQAVPNFDLEVTVRSGQRRWVNVSNLVYRDRRRGLTLMVHLARDISQTKDREIVLEKVQGLFQLLDGLRPGSEKAAPVAPLSPHQRGILRLFAQGKEAAEVAEALGITRQSLRNHLHRINQKLRTHNLLGAVTHAQQRHLL
ncbi:MAG TPA: PAS and helix-turn-helix domain-containing protein [Terriglobales bacterium]|nr:PAS and helix-turn-helix domain-containing protein [Terriglobales bacterium]